MNFIEKFLRKVRGVSTQEIVETLLSMRIVNQRSWDDIRLWLDGVWTQLDQSEKNRQWLEVQEQFRFASSTFFFQIAKGKNLAQERATEFAIKWTNLINFWFSNSAMPKERDVHLMMLEIDPPKEIELLISDIDAQDQRVTPYLLDWQANPVIAEGLKNLRWLQLHGASVSEMNKAWDKFIFSLD